MALSKEKSIGRLYWFTDSLQEKRILEQQLLTEQEIHELGLQALVPWLESHNLKLIICRLI